MIIVPFNTTAIPRAYFGVFSLPFIGAALLNALTPSPKAPPVPQAPAVPNQAEPAKVTAIPDHQPHIEEKPLPPPPEAPKLPTPMADMLDGAKGLKNGSKDPAAVVMLQKFLTKNGYGEMLGKTGPNHDGVDGVFKGKTESALEKFQVDHGLPKTGILDPDTLKKMHEVEAKPAAPAERRPSIDLPFKTLPDFFKDPPMFKDPPSKDIWRVLKRDVMWCSTPSEKALKVAGEDVLEPNDKTQMSTPPRRPMRGPGGGM